MRAVSAPCNSTRPLVLAFTKCPGNVAVKRKGAARSRATPKPETMESAEYQPLGFRGCCRVTRLDVRPVHDIPERLGEVDFDVLVLQVEGVFPHVEQQQRNDAQGEVGLVVVHLEYQELVAQRVPAECSPPRSLHGGRGCVELRTKRVERSERVIDGRSEFTGGLVTTVRRQVLPPDRVI